jgi:ATP-dependent RNA helicase RhlE
MPNSIVKLAGSFLVDPVLVEFTPEQKTVDRIDQTLMFVLKADKKLLLGHLLKTRNVEQAMVFTRTKHGANRVVKQLDQQGIEAQAIHGNKSQNARTKTLNAFRSGALKVLIATDVASRGIDVDGVSHVFNYDLPNVPESYVHRIGRTGRAGRGGQAIAFCDLDEGICLRDIERLIGESIPVDTDHEWHAADAMPRKGVYRKPAKKPQQNGRGGGRGGPPKNSGRSRQPRAEAAPAATPPKRRRRRRPSAS